MSIFFSLVLSFKNTDTILIVEFQYLAYSIANVTFSLVSFPKSSGSIILSKFSVLVFSFIVITGMLDNLTTLSAFEPMNFFITPLGDPLVPITIRLALIIEDTSTICS